MSSGRCLFLSHKNDLHVEVVAKLLRDIRVAVDVFPTDLVSSERSATFFATASLAPGAKATIRLADYDLIWSRRLRMPQRGIGSLDEEGRAFVDAECRAAFDGLCFTTAPEQIVVNPLLPERVAESKLWQLDAAQTIGFAIPETLCSNDPDDLREAAARLGHVVVKKLRGTHHRTPLTLDLTPAMLASDAELQAAPMILQARIEAALHYRVHVFLDQVLAFRIVSTELDWRPHAGRGATACRLDPATERRCLRFREVSGLYYCIIDLIEDRRGEIHFLECNPQGQFLFLEQRTGYPIARAFATMVLRLLGREACAGQLAERLPA